MAGFTYVTLPGHPESGEETFRLHIREGGDVVFAVHAVSKPGTALTRLAGALSAAVQRRFTDRYVAAMRALCTRGASSTIDQN